MNFIKYLPIIEKKYKYISLKWFKVSDNTAVPDEQIKREFLELPGIDSYEKVEQLYKTVTLNMDTGFWPELKYVTEAKKRGPLEGKRTLDIHITTKQYLILTMLLLHRSEHFFVLLQGKGGTGKSTFINIVKQLFENDTAALGLNKIRDFEIYETLTHRINCPSEINPNGADMDLFKSITAHDETTCRRKNSSAVTIKHPETMFLFSTNTEPVWDIGDDGIMRRAICHLMNKKIEKPNPNAGKLVLKEDELIDIVRYCLWLDQHGTFQDMKKVFDEETHEIITKRNSIRVVYEQNKGSLEDQLYDYDFYQSKCTQYHLKPFNIYNFEQIKAVLLEWGLIKCK